MSTTIRTSNLRSWAAGLALLLSACDPGGESSPPSTWQGAPARHAPQQASQVGAAVALERDEAPLAPQATGCGGSAPSSTQPAFEQELVELVNRERAAQGLPPLARSSALDQAARYHASDMATDVYFDHDTFDKVGGTLTRVCGFGDRLTYFYPSWSWLGENIALGQGTPEAAMASWMGSAGHRANILHTSYWELGVGYAAGNYWVQDFGTPGGTTGTRLVIDGEAARTTDADVTLYVYGTWTEMRLKNDDGPWSAWVPFAHSSTWRLTNLRGTRRVTVEVRRTTLTASDDDTIFLDIAEQPMPYKLYLPLVIKG